MYSLRFSRLQVRPGGETMDDGVEMVWPRRLRHHHLPGGLNLGLGFNSRPMSRISLTARAGRNGDNNRR